MKVLIATPAYDGKVTTQWFESLMHSFGTLGSEYQIGVITCLGDLISRARNSCAEFLLEKEFDKLMFIDSDISWTPPQLKILLESKSSIVGGTYPYKRFPMSMVLNVLDKHAHYFKEQELKTPEEFKTFATTESGLNGEVEVKHLPTGFLAIDASVFKTLKNKVSVYRGYDAPTKQVKDIHDFFPMGVVGGKYETEDWGFCSLARLNGFKVMLQTNCIVDHVRSHNFSFWR